MECIPDVLWAYPPTGTQCCDLDTGGSVSATLFLWLVFRDYAPWRSRWLCSTWAGHGPGQVTAGRICQQCRKPRAWLFYDPGAPTHRKLWVSVQWQWAWKEGAPGDQRPCRERSSLFCLKVAYDGIFGIISPSQEAKPWALPFCYSARPLVFLVSSHCRIFSSLCPKGALIRSAMLRCHLLHRDKQKSMT